MIDRPASVETTALGAAYLAGLGVGLFSDLTSIVRAHRIERSFEPTMTEEERNKHIARWKGAVVRARSKVG